MTDLRILDNKSTHTSIHLTLTSIWKLYLIMIEGNRSPMNHMDSQVNQLVDRLKDIVVDKSIATSHEAKLFKTHIVSMEGHSQKLIEIDSQKLFAPSIMVSLGESYVILLTCQYIARDSDQYPYIRSIADHLYKLFLRGIGGDYVDHYDEIFVIEEGDND